MRLLARLAPLAAVFMFVPGAVGDAPPKRIPLPPAIEFNAFEFRTDFGRRAVALREFLTDAFKDGIAAIDRPRFARAGAIRYLRPAEAVIEFAIGGDVRAYPIQVLLWHELVNDRVGGVPVAVTYCPLCNTAIAFDRRVDGRTLTFGVSGKLRNANLVMYDRETESWWQQFGGTGLVGRYAGKRLRRLPARIVAWGDFLGEHPDGLVLLRPAGRRWPYGLNPYAGYDALWSTPGYVYANSRDRRLRPKERVVFVERGGESVAVPLATVARRREVRVTVGGHRMVVRLVGSVASPVNQPGVHRGRRVAAVQVLENGKPVPFDTPFWFAVAAFQPEVALVP